MCFAIILILSSSLVFWQSQPLALHGVQLEEVVHEVLHVIVFIEGSTVWPIGVFPGVPDY
jgi:hypothetical protein